MLLRTRITLIVALGLVLTVLGLGSAGLLREQLLQQRLASTALAAQTSLWGEMLAAEDRLLDQGLDQLLADTRFLHAVRLGDLAALEQALQALNLLPGLNQIDADTGWRDLDRQRDVARDREGLCRGATADDGRKLVAARRQLDARRRAFIYRCAP